MFCRYPKILKSFSNDNYNKISLKILGDSKGYGLIKYVSSDAAAQARHLLDGRTVTCPKFPHMSYSLNCDWLSSSHITFKSLHSKALLVERLPPGYRDLKEFRNICSVVQKPAFSNVSIISEMVFTTHIFNT